jgi:predicted RNase H-like HicB family nuclease
LNINSIVKENEELALKDVKIAIELWLETAHKEGREIPQPRGKDFLNSFYETTVSITRPQKA